MKVSVIDGDGAVITMGECESITSTGYAKVNGQFYSTAYVYKAEHTDEIIAELKKHSALVKAAKDEQLRVQMELGNKYRARNTPL